MDTTEYFTAAGIATGIVAGYFALSLGAYGIYKAIKVCKNKISGRSDAEDVESISQTPTIAGIYDTSSISSISQSRSSSSISHYPSSSSISQRPSIPSISHSVSISEHEEIELTEVVTEDIVTVEKAPASSLQRQPSVESVVIPYIIMSNTKGGMAYTIDLKNIPSPPKPVRPKGGIAFTVKY